MDIYLLGIGFSGLLLIVALFQINNLQEIRQELRDMHEVLLIQKQAKKTVLQLV